MYFCIIPKEDDEISALRNQINIIIANLANIKDCLKNKITKNGGNREIIETEINNSIYLQIIMDLANQEKHGYPLTITRRSKKDPRVENIHRALTISNKQDDIVIRRSDGAAIKNCMTTIVADIVDANGNFLYRLDDLVQKVLESWETIIKKYNIK